MKDETVVASTELEETTVNEFESGFQGEVIRPDGESYEEARSVWNGMIQKCPALIARCTGTADVVRAVQFARNEGLEVAVRGGGHNVAGTALCEGGIVIDCSEMKGIDVDPSARRVRAQAGVIYRELDRETQLHGLAAPGGVVSDTGIAGLTLGGGIGHLRRKYGLSCDALTSAEVVTADGRVLRTDENNHEDLFWALRGGGGNFGVVTSFEYELYEVGPEVATCFVWYPVEPGSGVLEQFRDYCQSAPDEVSLLSFYAYVPDLPEFFPEEHWGKPSIAILGCYSGEPEQGTREFQKVRRFNEPLADLSGTMPYVELQQMLDEDYPEGRNYYWKSLYLDEFGEDAIQRFLEFGEEMPSEISTLDIWQLGGAISWKDSTDTAFANREAPFLLGIEANWDDPERNEENIQWARDAFDSFQEFSRGGLYVNFPGMGEEGEQLVRSVYDENYARLREVKAKYDPDNVFHVNQNIRPAS